MYLKRIVQNNAVYFLIYFLESSRFLSAQTLPFIA